VTRLEGLFNAVGNLLRGVGHVLVQIPAMTPVTPVEKVGKARATKPKARPVRRTPEEIADRAAFFSRPDGDDRGALAERAATTRKEGSAKGAIVSLSKVPLPGTEDEQADQNLLAYLLED